ncbi:heat shock protein Hsp20 [Hydrogenispora ethanolica]|jgi:HSP20 family protein|uniref:Heat shock protein Hsp20 n=1 Tax=Hydrogenispora ethanolica TaxID=1082276 RepID=A0A4R1QM05_HYDET|nr:Hsp20/alpha crystallin family protein [Hydrogenispora ethanolica]TCL54749.1 heat shock protein Hsp20 [Hydrogenispora ethanolica]
MENKNWLSPFGNDLWSDRFFNQLVPRGINDFFKGGNFGPSVDLRETDREIILHADIPGVNREDLDITVDENVVILKGEIKKDETRTEKGYHLSERRYGSFYRTIPLPAEVHSEQATARYKDGVLELRIPKMEATTKRGFKPRIEADDHPVQ